MKKSTFICLFICSLMTVSCTIFPSSAVLEDKSCQAPCWRNIYMGMEEDKAISMLQKMDDIQKNTIEVNQTNRAYWDEVVGWDFINRQENSGGILFHDGKVTMIFFYEQGSPLANVIFLKGISLSKLIQKNDVPDQVWAVKGVLDTTVINIYFMYPKKGICYKYTPSWPFYNSDLTTYRVSSSLGIEEIDYFDPLVSMDEYNIGCVWPIDNSLIQVWKGYGDYSVYSEK